MTILIRAETPRLPTPAATDFHCVACGNWILTAPSPWARGRCMNRRCRLYRQQQTMYAPRSTDRTSTVHLDRVRQSDT
jgi:hypothetical protein